MLQGTDDSLAPRPRALAALAETLTARPWALTPEIIDEVRQNGLDEEQVEAAITVAAVFNYFTRVADASGIKFDYETPLPAFEPDLQQISALRPDIPVPSHQAQGRRQHQNERLRAAWQRWRTFVLESNAPLSRRERQLAASVAAQESGDWEAAEALGGTAVPGSGDEQLVEFARKLSREPWRMLERDLDGLRAAGYSEVSVLHVISVVSHQNADSRLTTGLRAANPT